MTTLPKFKVDSKKQRVKVIRTYVKQGYSANKIQKKLQKQGLGIQRKKLLAEVRKIKGQLPKANRFKYTPKKYRKIPKDLSSSQGRKWNFFEGKSVAVYLTVKTKRHPKPYSSRYEFCDSTGKDLAKAIRLAFSGIVPRHELPFVKCSARDFLKNPYFYGEKGVWLGKPNVES